MVGQRPLVGAAKLRQEVQGTAKEDHVPADRMPTSEPRDGLGRHRREHRSRQVGVGGALVQQGLQVGLGEHAAAGRDRVQVEIPGRELIQSARVRVQQGCHLVDEGTGTTGASAVHPLLDDRVQIGDLGVLTAEFDHHIGLGHVAFDGRGRRDHFLDEVDAHQLGHT